MLSSCWWNYIFHGVINNQEGKSLFENNTGNNNNNTNCSKKNNNKNNLKCTKRYQRKKKKVRKISKCMVLFFVDWSVWWFLTVSKLYEQLGKQFPFFLLPYLQILSLRIYNFFSPKTVLMRWCIWSRSTSLDAWAVQMLKLLKSSWFAVWLCGSLK